jgi:hypothetical protein
MIEDQISNINYRVFLEKLSSLAPNRENPLPPETLCTRGSSLRAMGASADKRVGAGYIAQD